MSSERVLVIDDFGGRVTYREAGSLMPKKHHLHLQFDDESGLTVAIHGWWIDRTSDT